ncbi:hypothetical protein ASG90_00140 [Nocardioides sp. Soil797]|nr:hypothetical protein ASG90_00140 [Nocardioides sp. Soil797]
MTRSQALAAGYTERELRTLTGHGGGWVTVRRGIYIRSDEWESLDAREAQPLRRALAAHLAMTRPHALSHTSAGLVHGIDMLRPGDDLVHITRPGVTGSRTEHGVKHHLAHFTQDQVVDVGGVPTLDLARTAVDIGREHGYLQGLVACDSVLQKGATRAQLLEAVEMMDHWPYVTGARAAVLDSDAGAESVGETLTRVLVQSLGLGAVQTQFSVTARGQTFWVDLRVGRHLIEFDGRMKYRRSEEGGIANRDPGDVVWSEKMRQDAICAEGYGMSRVVWNDVWGAAREETAARLLREYAETTRRFGTQLPPGYVPVSRHRLRPTA